MTVTVSGEVPAKKNSRLWNTKTKFSFPNKRYTEWHGIAMLEVLSQLKGWKAPVPCSITVTFIHGDRIRRDGDNGLSSVMDMLKDAGVIIDDCWKYVAHEEVWHDYDKGKPRCVIEINDYRPRGTV